MMRISLFLFVLACVASSLLHARGSTTAKAQFRVAGNCGMCKTRIEKAVNITEVKYRKWSKATQMLTVAYLRDRITLDSLQQRVAAGGHDTERFKAPDSVYASLLECCLYRKVQSEHPVDPGRREQ